MKLFFIPVSVAAGIVAGQASKKLFDAMWGLVDDEEAPHPHHREIPYAKLLAALVVEGAIARLVRGMVDHGARQGWSRVTGTWPGEERPEPA
jgi:Protein of unknown function (DUF4235)